MSGRSLFWIDFCLPEIQNHMKKDLTNVLEVDDASLLIIIPVTFHWCIGM